MTLHLTAPRATALAVTAHAENAADARLLLEALGLVAPVVVSQPLVVPPHERHGRSAYVPGCARCRAANRAYIAAWRMRGKGRSAVTTRRRLALVELAARAGRGRRAAYPGQLMLDLTKETA